MDFVDGEALSVRARVYAGNELSGLYIKIKRPSTDLFNFVFLLITKM